MDTPSCPACTAPQLIIMQKGVLKCSYCGSTFKGIPLVCPSCGWINTIDAEICPECGEPLSMIAQVIRRQDTSGSPRWLSRVQSQAEKIKSSGEEASKLRLDELQEIDRKREEAVAEQMKQRTKTDRVIYSIALIFGIMIIIVILLIWFFLR